MISARVVTHSLPSVVCNIEMALRNDLPSVYNPTLGRPFKVHIRPLECSLAREVLITRHLRDHTKVETNTSLADNSDTLLDQEIILYSA